MTSEWPLDIDNIRKKACTSDPIPASNSIPTTNNDAAKYTQQRGYFSSVKDGAKVKKGEFKTVAVVIRMISSIIPANCYAQVLMRSIR